MDAFAIFAMLSTCGSDTWRNSFNTHYDAIVLGSGAKESLISALLASQGKRVLLLEKSAQLGHDTGGLDLNQLYESIVGPDASPEQKLGSPDEYSVDLIPKALMASGTGISTLVDCGLWRHMDFRRVHRALIYRLRPDGEPDVHRVLSSAEDILKTRMLPPLDKPRVLQMFGWLEQFREEDPESFNAGRLAKRRLNLYKMSAASFYRFWELQPQTIEMLTRSMAGYTGTIKSLKRLPAIELVQRMQRFKQSYRTFPHMTSPYIYPTRGLGAALSRATSKVVEAHGGVCLSGRPIDQIVFDETGRACGVSCDGEIAHADCIVAGPSYVPERFEQSYQIVRLYAILAHAPHKCKDARSLHLLIPASHCGRKHDIYVLSSGSAHQIAPTGKWLVTVSTRIEGPTEGLRALDIAKREFAAVIPLLRPARKMLAQVVPCYEPEVSDAAIRGLHVVGSSDETTLFDNVAGDAADLVSRIAEA